MVTLDTKEATLSVDGSATETTEYNMGKLRLRLTGDYFIGKGQSEFGILRQNLEIRMHGFILI